MLHALLQWGDTWIADEPPVRLHHCPPGTAGDHAVDMAWVCWTCGEPVSGSPLRRVVTGTDDHG